MLTAIVYGLTPRREVGRAPQPRPAAAGHRLGPVLGVIVALLLGASVLMGTVAFSGQRFFEWQLEAQTERRAGRAPSRHPGLGQQLQHLDCRVRQSRSWRRMAGGAMPLDAWSAALEPGFERPQARQCNAGSSSASGSSTKARWCRRGCGRVSTSLLHRQIAVAAAGPGRACAARCDTAARGRGAARWPAARAAAPAAAARCRSSATALMKSGPLASTGALRYSDEQRHQPCRGSAPSAPQRGAHRRPRIAQVGAQADEGAHRGRPSVSRRSCGRRVAGRRHRRPRAPAGLRRRRRRLRGARSSSAVGSSRWPHRRRRRCRRCGPLRRHAPRRLRARARPAAGPRARRRRPGEKSSHQSASSPSTSPASARRRRKSKPARKRGCSTSATRRVAAAALEARLHQPDLAHVGGQLAAAGDVADARVEHRVDRLLQRRERRARRRPCSAFQRSSTSCHSRQASMKLGATGLPSADAAVGVGQRQADELLARRRGAALASSSASSTGTRRGAGPACAARRCWPAHGRSAAA